MIDSFELKNFRCFDAVKVTGLSRINILVGRNASGKTALLEALFFACGASPEIAIRLKNLRGLPFIEISNERPAYEALWKDLFFQFTQNQPIRITLRSGQSDLRILEISYGSPQGVLLPSASLRPSLDTSFIAPITFQWRTQSGQEAAVQPQFTERGIALPIAINTPPIPSVFISSANMPNPAETAGWFSQLSIENRDEQLTGAIRDVFESLEDLSIEVTAGIPSIYAAVRGLNAKLPINLVSSGLTKVLAICLAIVRSANGMVLVDEIENGMHYTILAKVWERLSKLAEQNNTQIFASTHSAECLAAAMRGVTTAGNNLSLLKLQRTKERATVRCFSGDALQAAVQDSVEVR